MCGNQNNENQPGKKYQLYLSSPSPSNHTSPFPRHLASLSPGKELYSQIELEQRCAHVQPLGRRQVLSGALLVDDHRQRAGDLVHDRADLLLQLSTI